ncbi:Protein kinase domain-containing protein [Aspergillus flavus AF70]|nr:Protein kinase domain-containing protein [Aspergillus flavus AF70]
MAISIADRSCSPTRSLGLLLDPEKADLPRPKQSMWHRFGLRRWLGRDDRDSSQSTAGGASFPSHHNKHNSSNDPNNANAGNTKPHDNLTRKLSKKVGVGLPRSTTFKRQNSERRDNLAPLEPEPRRAASADRPRTLSAQRTRSRSPPPTVNPRLSAPEVPWHDPDETTVEELPEANEESDLRSEWDPYPAMTEAPEEPPEDVIEMELEKRWILNLSMHFRDRSEREKFFVTYAETPNRWRRVTISCDYRGAPPDSLEQDLKELRYQRDKCARIYESIRESLTEIQFYDTVTNLKLETRDGRLHVHVTEDVNEIIPYPPISCIGHLPDWRLVREDQLHFEAHLSGFVYNVRLNGKSYIKKEIPGPDTVDEFLYEINALHALQDIPNVVQVEGVVVDEHEEVVKGLLISFAEKGALVDILYEHRGTISWEQRERWAKQIVRGLCEIHEAGYVQGDFTLSNIVVDANDDAQIIDINRRGCPVGWEPPEIAAKIESNQRISMYIGVKTDLYQLGMTLWALAMEEDEPERQPRPLILGPDVDVPDYYRRLVAVCLSSRPRDRLSAKELLNFFPPEYMLTEQPPPLIYPRHMSHGIGLNNGALPLYNHRVIAAPGTFLNHHAGPVDSTGWDLNVPLSLDDGYDSQCLDPNPLAGFEEEEQRGRTRERRDSKPLESNIKPEPHSLGHHIDSTASAAPTPFPIDLGSDQARTHLPTQRDRENEIDLDADLDPRYRDLSLERAANLLPLETDTLSGSLAGVGSHPACSFGPSSTKKLSPDSANCGDSPLSAATQSTDSYAATVPDLGHALIRDQDWSSQMPSRSVSSLLHSILPINPALNLPESKLMERTAERFSPLTVRSALGYPRQILQNTPYLSDSHLPINPAFPDKALTSV